MTNQPNENDSRQVHIHYVLSQNFNVIHMTGVVGGISPVGEIQMAFYVDRTPYPSEIIHTLKNGRLSAEIGRTVVEGFEREIQVEVRMSLAQTVRLRNWLDQKINTLESLGQGQSAQGEDGEEIAPS